MSGAEDVLWRWPSGLIFGDMTQPINRNLSEDFSLLKLYLQKYTYDFMNEKQISKHIIILSLKKHKYVILQKVFAFTVNILSIACIYASCLYACK